MPIPGMPAYSPDVLVVSRHKEYGVCIELQRLNLIFTSCTYFWTIARILIPISNQCAITVPLHVKTRLWL